VVIYVHLNKIYVGTRVSQKLSALHFFKFCVVCVWWYTRTVFHLWISIVKYDERWLL